MQLSLQLASCEETWHNGSVATNPAHDGPALTTDAVDLITAQWNRERPDLDTEPMAVFGRIYRLARAMGDRIEQVYGQFGIGRGEFDVLATLRRSGEPFSLSPTALADSLMLTTGGMTGRLDKLQKAWPPRAPTRMTAGRSRPA